MERTAWTEERLDDLLASVRNGFARTDQDIRDVRSEQRAESAELRTEMREGFSEVRAEIDALRQTMLRAGAAMLGTMCFGFLSVIAAVILRGG